MPPLGMKKQQVMVAASDGVRRDSSVELPAACAGSSCDAALVCFHPRLAGLYSGAAASETPIILSETPVNSLNRQARIEWDFCLSSVTHLNLFPWLSRVTQLSPLKNLPAYLD